VRFGYQLAATVANWILTPGAGRQVFSITGDVTVMSEHWIEQEPLSLTLDVGFARWTWKEVTPHIAAGRVSVQVHGRPHVEHLN